MRVQSAMLLTVAMLFALVVDEALVFGVAPRLLTTSLAAEPVSAREMQIAASASVRDAEAAERRACVTIASLDLFGPRRTCQAR